MNDFRTVRDFLFSPVLLALMESPVSLVFLVLIFAISPVLGWAAVVAAILQTFVGWLNERSTQPPLLAANRSAMAAQQYADGTLRNAQVIESMGMLRDIHGRWMDKQREFLGLQAQASDKAGFYQAISKFLQNVVGSLLLGLGAWLLLRNQLNGGAAYMIVGSILGGRVLAPLIQIVSQWQNVINVRDAYQRLDGLLIMVPERQPGMPLPAPEGQLLVESLVAGAPGSPVPILKGVNFGRRQHIYVIFNKPDFLIGGYVALVKTPLLSVLPFFVPSNTAAAIRKADTYIAAANNLGIAQSEILLGGNLRLEGLPAGLWSVTAIIADSAAIDFDDPATWDAWDVDTFILGKPWEGAINKTCL
jgi:ABC-type multidrug transport system fused ATPase/permease subunit